MIEHYISLIKAGKLQWDQFKPVLRSFAPLLDSMFKHSPQHPAVVKAVAGMPPVPPEVGTFTHYLDLIDAGEMEWDRFAPLIDAVAPEVDRLIELLHPGHPAIRSALADMPPVVAHAH